MVQEREKKSECRGGVVVEAEIGRIWERGTWKLTGHSVLGQCSRLCFSQFLDRSRETHMTALFVSRKQSRRLVGRQGCVGW